MTTTAETLSVRLVGDLSDLQASVGQADKLLAGLVDRATSLGVVGQAAGAKFAAGFSTIEGAAAAGGVALIALAGAAVKVGAESEAAFAAIANNLPTATAGFSALREELAGLAENSGRSLSSVQQLAVTISRMGVDNAEDLKKQTDAAVTLSDATGVGLEDAATLLQQLRREFHLTGDQALETAAQLYAGAKQGHVGVDELFQAFRQSTPTFQKFNIDVDTGTRAIIALAAQGEPARKIGTILAGYSADKIKEVASRTTASADAMQQLTTAADRTRESTDRLYQTAKTHLSASLDELGSHILPVVNSLLNRFADVLDRIADIGAKGVIKDLFGGGPTITSGLGNLGADLLRGSQTRPLNSDPSLAALVAGSGGATKPAAHHTLPMSDADEIAAARDQLKAATFDLEEYRKKATEAAKAQDELAKVGFGAAEKVQDLNDLIAQVGVYGTKLELLKSQQQEDKEIRAADDKFALDGNLREAMSATDGAHAEREARDALILRRVATVDVTKVTEDLTTAGQKHIEKTHAEVEETAKQIKAAQELADAINHELVQAIDSFSRHGQLSFTAFLQAAERFTAQVSVLLKKANDDIGATVAALANAGLAGGATGYAIGAQTGTREGGVLGGIAAGAIEGSAAGPWGAVIGGFSGVIGGLLGAASAHQKAAAALKAAAEAASAPNYNRQAEGFLDAGGPDLKAKVDQIFRSYDQLQQLVLDQEKSGAIDHGTAKSRLDALHASEETQVQAAVDDFWSGITHDLNSLTGPAGAYANSVLDVNKAWAAAKANAEAIGANTEQLAQVDADYQGQLDKLKAAEAERLTQQAASLKIATDTAAATSLLDRQAVEREQLAEQEREELAAAVANGADAATVANLAYKDSLEQTALAAQQAAVLLQAAMSDIFRDQSLGFITQGQSLDEIKTLFGFTGLSDAQIRALYTPYSGTPLTDAQEQTNQNVQAYFQAAGSSSSGSGGAGASAGSGAAAGTSPGEVAVSDVRNITTTQGSQIADDLTATLAVDREQLLVQQAILDLLRTTGRAIITPPQIPFGLGSFAGAGGALGAGGTVTIQVSVQQTFNGPVGQVDRAAALAFGTLIIEEINAALASDYLNAQRIQGKVIQV
jgi:hypothetical protein